MRTPGIPDWYLSEVSGQQNNGPQAQQQTGTQVVTPDAYQTRVMAGGYQKVVDYKQGTIDGKGTSPR